VTATIVVCTDGSDLAISAAREGLAILLPADQVLVVTIVDADEVLVADGSGHAGPSMTAQQFDDYRNAALATGQAAIDATIEALGGQAAVGRIIEGRVGPGLCEFAREIDARALVLGSRGRGGIRRALLGSVSDYVVRNAPCPVVVIGTDASAAHGGPE
jgi:nucleotide-binding universal stress UspA family protein